MPRCSTPATASLSEFSFLLSWRLEYGILFNSTRLYINRARYQMRFPHRNNVSPQGGPASSSLRRSETTAAISSSPFPLQKTRAPLSYKKAPEFVSEASYDFFKSMSSGYYFRILLTTPAPTVRPPSRIAKRKPSSIAIGAISCTFILMLSPGITILTSSGSIIVPVTSVVRK